MTTATKDGKRMLAVAVDSQSGKIVKTIPILQIANPEPKNKLNSYASPSPAVADGRLFVYFGTYGAACIDIESKRVVWVRRDLQLDHQEGPGSSPILDGRKLIVHCDGRDKQYVVALDRASGRTLWMNQRSIALRKVPDFSRKAFTTPYIVSTPYGRRMISPAAQGCYCYDPDSGKEIWRIRYKGFSAVPRPVTKGNLAYVVTTFANPQVLAVRMDQQGDVTDTAIKWRYGRNGPSTPSPILVGRHLMFVSDKGVVTCVDCINGQRLWVKRVGGNFCASPIAANGHVYFFDRSGKCTIFKADKRPTIVATNKLAEGMMASPAAIGNKLILRTTEHLYCIK